MHDSAAISLYTRRQVHSGTFAYKIVTTIPKVGIPTEVHSHNIEIIKELNFFLLYKNGKCNQYLPK